MSARLEDVYDKAVDDFNTGDIHLLDNNTLFSFISKRGLSTLSECSVVDVQERWNATEKLPEEVSLF